MNELASEIKIIVYSCIISGNEDSSSIWIYDVESGDIKEHKQATEDSITTCAWLPGNVLNNYDKSRVKRLANVVLHSILTLEVSALTLENPRNHKLSLNP